MRWLAVAPASLTGLSKFGLARGQLAGAGLSASTVERLYRSLYVYTVGFHDTLKELLTHSSERASLIAGVWRSFMTIAEKSLKLNWRSEFLQILEVPWARVERFSLLYIFCRETHRAAPAFE